MFNKKADYGLPIYFFPVMVFFIFILVLFSMIFFVQGISASPNLVIKSEAYYDSSNIMVILRSPTEVQQNGQNLSIAELISLAEKNNDYHDELSKNLDLLLLKLPKVPKGKNLADVIIATPSSTRETIKSDRWNIDIIIDNNNFLHSGEKADFSDDYLFQSVVIPIEEGKTAEINLYLNCFACTEEDINVIS